VSVYNSEYRPRPAAGCPPSYVGVVPRWLERGVPVIRHCSWMPGTGTEMLTALGHAKKRRKLESLVFGPLNTMNGTKLYVTRAVVCLDFAYTFLTTFWTL
jgi:hypothetical protein